MFLNIYIFSFWFDWSRLTGKNYKEMYSLELLNVAFGRIN